MIDQQEDRDRQCEPTPRAEDRSVPAPDREPDGDREGYVSEESRKADRQGD